MSSIFFRKYDAADAAPHINWFRIGVDFRCGLANRRERGEVDNELSKLGRRSFLQDESFGLVKSGGTQS